MTYGAPEDDLANQEAALQAAAQAIHDSDAWGEPCKVDCSGARLLSRRMAEQALAAYVRVRGTMR